MNVKKLPKTWTFFSKKLPKFFIFSKKLPLANFGNYLTFKWQFSGGSERYIPIVNPVVKYLKVLTIFLPQVILQFDKNFWSTKTQGKTMFGYVPTADSQRGLFNLFHHIANEEVKLVHIFTPPLWPVGVFKLCHKQ